MPRFLHLAGWLAACLLLAGCPGGKPGAGAPKWMPGGEKGRQVEPPTAQPTPAPATVEDLKARESRLKDERDQLKQQLALKDQEIENNAKRVKEQEQADALAARKREATFARWIAGLCFAASVLITIISFTPYGAIIPKWAGPVGMGAGVVILVAAGIWVWVAEHLLYFYIGSGVVGALVLLFVGHKALLLVLSRQRFHDASEGKAGADLIDLKASQIEAEIKLGVHTIGQRLRRKLPKTMADVMNMRIEAAAMRKAA
jgi:hypothetical protein